MSLLSTFLFAQEPYAIHYTINESLPTNTIYSSFQAKNGYIWFATDVGVIKYNGKKFELFTTDNGLTDNEVFNIREDYKGRKWLLTLNGVPSFIYKNKIYNETNSKIIRQIKNKSLLIDFYQDEKNTIYLLSKDGKVTIIKSDDSVESVSLNDVTASGIWKDKATLNILTSEGIQNTKNQKVTVSLLDNKMPFRFYHQNNQNFYNNFNVLKEVLPNSIIKDVLRVSIKTEILNIFKESISKTWICTRKGLFLFENNIQKKHYFKKEPITSITKDIEENYWITTINNGVFMIPSFDVLARNIGINCISKKNENEIWFGGKQNDFYIKKGTTFAKKELNVSWRKDNIANIRFFNDETYVIGKTGTLKLTINNQEEVALGINDLIEVSDTLFIGTNYFSKIYNKDFSFKSATKIIENKILERRTNVLAKNTENTIFLGTNFGLYSYNLQSKIFFKGDIYKELKASIKDLFFDKENNFLLVATSSKGVLVLKEGKLLFSISHKDGLNNNTVNTIEKTALNTYLIGTNKGINALKITDESFTIKNYNSSLGLNNKRINAISRVKNTTYIATNNQLIYFKNGYLKERKTRPICFIDGVYAKNVKIEDLSKMINYSNDDFRIQFTGISFLDRENITYYYKLNDKNWTSTKEPQITYKELPPNLYTFSLYCSNSFGEKSNIKTITFRIKKPFWQQWWFIVIVLLLFSSFLFFIIKSRLDYVNNQFKKERKALLLEKENIVLENQMLDLEQKALRLQMNPHFIFNALNTIKGYYSEGNVQEASNYISKFSKLLRLLLENVDQYIPLELEIEMLELYMKLVQVRYRHKFVYKIIVDKKIHQKEIGIPTLLMQPLIENAIIHGVAPKNGNGKIIVSFKIIENQLICTITDDGIGRKASQKNKRMHHKSKALEITKSRLQLIENQEKKPCSLHFFDLMNKEEPIGTKVVIKIPIINIW